MFIALIKKIRYLSIFPSILYLTFFIKKKNERGAIRFQFPRYDETNTISFSRMKGEITNLANDDNTFL